jgi:hypothetical protein
MPNFCQNRLEVSGDVAVIEQFANRVRKGNSILSFDSLIPTPPEMLVGDALLGASPAWYTWRCENWGTKWDAQDSLDVEGVQQYNKHFCLVTQWMDGVDFLTAWSPPSAFVEKASALYPELTFMLRFYEGGVGFAGEQCFEDGELISELILEDETSEEYKEYRAEHFGYEEEVAL